MSAPPASLHTENLPTKGVERATQNARRDGAFAGLTSGLLGAILGHRMKLGRNASIASGLLTGGLAGYYFTQGFLMANMSRLRMEFAEQQERERNNASISTDSNPSQPT